MGTNIDPVTLEILWSRLISVVNEQAAALMRTSFTTIVRESGDLSAGVFDTRGNMVAQAVTGTPGHINAMATCIHHFLAVYPAETLGSGDVLITNDPQKTSGHLHDFTVITPIFRQDDLVGFFGNTCHVLDIGGRGMGTDARSVYEEGMFVPITKIYDRGRENSELLKLIAANVRVPEPVIGDIHAQVVANDVGGRFLNQFMDEFELESIDPVADEIIARSERAMRAAIATIPDGKYSAEVVSDGYEAPVTLRVTITKQDDEMDVDWAGSSLRSEYGINVVLNYTHAYTTYALKCALAPDVPNNEGSFRPVKVSAPPDSILNAQHPAPVCGRHILGHFLPGAIFEALSQVIPDQVLAEGAANIWSTQLSGEMPDGDIWTYVWFSTGGTGARPNKDGLNATAFPSGISGVPAEVMEALAPMVVRRRALRIDSGGAGKYRGGLGQEFVFEVRSRKPYTFSSLFDRTRHPASGYAGGLDGALAEIEINNGEFITRKGARTLSASDSVTLRLPGGGGFYSPLERPLNAVLTDVLDGFVSIGSAKEDYRVVIDPLTLAIDIEKTEMLRRNDA